LIAASVRGLQHEYTESQRERALAKVFGVDTQLIADGTYFVAEVDGATVACGGWSKRRTLFGGDHFTTRESALLNPAVEAAKIRAFFVHPAWARKGIGTRVLEACESAASAEGFRKFEMGATLSGVGLYEARGYRRVEEIRVELGGGEVLEIVKMEKCISNEMQ
jgi:GNAT superfamily N-acetyltransferase